MEGKIVVSASPDGTLTQPLSATEAVAAVLCKGRRKATFLKNVGLVSSRTKATKSQLQLQLDTERAGKLERRALVHDFQMLRQQSEAEKNNAQEKMQAMQVSIDASKKSRKCRCPSSEAACSTTIETWNWVANLELVPFIFGFMVAFW